jgi:hypothetical protein
MNILKLRCIFSVLAAANFFVLLASSDFARAASHEGVTGERLFMNNDVSQARQAFRSAKALLTLNAN